MNKFLLLGPSGVGKSSASKIIKLKNNSIIVYDLDEVIKEHEHVNSISNYFTEIGNEEFFNKSKDIIENYKSDSTILFVIGAGSIDYSLGHKWYRDQNTISITGDPSIIFERGNRNCFHSSLEDYIRIEFSSERVELYNNAKYIIDVSNMSEQQVANEIMSVIINNK